MGLAGAEVAIEGFEALQPVRMGDPSPPPKRSRPTPQVKWQFECPDLYDS